MNGIKIRFLGLFVLKGGVFSFGWGSLALKLSHQVKTYEQQKWTQSISYWSLTSDELAWHQLELRDGSSSGFP